MQNENPLSFPDLGAERARQMSARLKKNSASLHVPKDIEYRINRFLATEGFWLVVCEISLFCNLVLLLVWIRGYFSSAFGASVFAP